MSNTLPNANPCDWKMATHTVRNQPTPLDAENLFSGDQILREFLPHFAVEADDEALIEYGALAAGPLLESGRLANRNVPENQPYDRFGHRIDQVEYHPAYHDLMRTGVAHGIHALPWSDPGPGQQIRRACLHYLHSQAESGTGCPLTMTYACVPAIQSTPSLAQTWLPGVFSRAYDPRDIAAQDKTGLTIGMAMTEKQGGSDVRSNTSWAKPLAGVEPGAAFEMVGHKWFCSAPMSDAFLALAQIDAGLTCFLLPRWRDADTRNQFHIQRLKDKLGNRANASSEVEFRGALGYLVGEPGRGVATIMEMVALTRIDCMIGSTALMRQALSQAIYYCRNRQTFGRLLSQHALMQNVLADMALDVEAALALTLYCVHLLEQRDDAKAAAILRLAVPVGKYWVCKRAPVLICEAAECLGGSGYVEESILPRLYRDAPVNAIWEGSGNVQCLDVLRVLDKVPMALPAVFALLDEQAADLPDLAPIRQRIAASAGKDGALEGNARILGNDLALALSAVALHESGSPWASDYLRVRTQRAGGNYGTLPSETDFGAIIDRAALR